MALTNIKFCKEAQDLFDKNGLGVSMSIDYGYDRRDFFPDTISYEILKDGVSMFNYKCRGETSEGREGPEGEFGTEPISACLDCASDSRYNEQASKFRRLVAELLDLKKNHKLSKFGEKRELKEECKKLCTYRETGSFPKGQPNYTINVPLLESNRALLEQVLAELTKMKDEMNKAAQSKKAEEPQEAGPMLG